MGVFDAGGEPTPVEGLRRTVCRVHLVPSHEKHAAVPADIVSPWFNFKDGYVRFSHPTSQWFIGGRKIESFECKQFN